MPARITDQKLRLAFWRFVFARSEAEEALDELLDLLQTNKYGGWSNPEIHVLIRQLALYLEIELERHPLSTRPHYPKPQIR
jgi:hypothetical protein